MSEIWKDIYFWQDGIEWDYRGLYKVSNYGRIKSFHTGKEKIMKQWINSKGYWRVNLHENRKMKAFEVHRLVAHMFIEGYFEGAEVDHIDTNPLNNHVSNLRWCTNKENMNNELTKKHCSEAREGKLIERYSLDGRLIDIKYQFEYVAMGFHSSGISSCCTGRYKSTGGYVFKYHEE